MRISVRTVVIFAGVVLACVIAWIAIAAHRAGGPPSASVATNAPPKASAAAGGGAAAPAKPPARAPGQDPVLLAGSLFDACTTPSQPAEPPSGATATHAQMLASQISAKDFDTATNVYLACVDQAASAFNKQYGRFLSPASMLAVRNLQVKIHNDAVTVDESVAGKFNQELRTFKARGATP